MAQEIERKFLLRTTNWMQAPNRTSSRYVQAYIMSDAQRTVRIRIAGDQGKITIKGKTAPGSFSRLEFEYTIPREDAEALLELCNKPWIEKVRHVIPHAGHTWEIDVFEGDNAGLIVAEIELQSEDESFEKPEWIGEEVTMDKRYTNASLVNYPFNQWI